MRVAIVNGYGELRSGFLYTRGGLLSSTNAIGREGFHIGVGIYGR